MAERIEQLPMILDCFGNAATEGNANSSRHLRYLELTFTESGKLSGAIIYLYLLEKWRISPTLSKSVSQSLFHLNCVSVCSIENLISTLSDRVETITSFTTSITD